MPFVKGQSGNPAGRASHAIRIVWDGMPVPVIEAQPAQPALPPRSETPIAEQDQSVSDDGRDVAVSHSSAEPQKALQNADNLHVVISDSNVRVTEGEGDD
jgi:hypothetical protein